eukprot:COSAG02_NODE_5307_length_4450_cov_7.677545_3_plen_45_part_00
MAARGRTRFERVKLCRESMAECRPVETVILTCDLTRDKIPLYMR